VPFSANTYKCHCRDRFVGHSCEIDPNPCASGPCLNDGTYSFQTIRNITVGQLNDLIFYTITFCVAMVCVDYAVKTCAFDA